MKYLLLTPSKKWKKKNILAELLSTQIYAGYDKSSL